jgi:hypothetical protein
VPVPVVVMVVVPMVVVPPVCRSADQKLSA